MTGLPAIGHSSYSPRPGFTLLGRQPSEVGPVVVHVDGTRESFRALRAASDHAMNRSCSVVVIDSTGKAATEPALVFADIEEREAASAVTIFHNEHVSIVDDLPDTGYVPFLTGLGTSLLVLSSNEVTSLASDPAHLRELIEAPFDLMLLTPDDPQIASSATSEAGSIRPSQAQ
jgi:hypothetical protein